MVDGPTDDQTPEDEQPDIDSHTSEQDRAGLDYLVSVTDARVQAYFDQNWPTMMEAAADRMVEKLPIDQIAAKAEQLFTKRWNETAARNQAAAAGGGGGDNGQRPTASGADGGGGDGDASFLNDVPDGDPSNQAPSMPHATDPKQAVAMAGMRFLEDPMGFLERGANLFYDIQDRRRPKTPARNDLDVIEDLATRRPYLIDIFASQDPMSAPEKIAEAMYAGARSGMSVAEAMAKYNIRAATTSKPAPRFKPPEITVDPAPPPPTPPTPAPAAAMAQDPPPARRRRRLQDAV